MVAGSEFGDWRVIFIEDEVQIVVVAVGNRRNIYD